MVISFWIKAFSPNARGFCTKSSLLHHLSVSEDMSQTFWYGCTEVACNLVEFGSQVNWPVLALTFNFSSNSYTVTFYFTCSRIKVLFNNFLLTSTWEFNWYMKMNNVFTDSWETQYFFQLHSWELGLIAVKWIKLNVIAEKWYSHPCPQSFCWFRKKTRLKVGRSVTSGVLKTDNGYENATKQSV